MKTSTALVPDELGAPFRVGEQEVRPRAAEVVSAEGRRRVDRMSMKVLVYLARRSGQEVSRAELLDAVWEGRAVTDEVLTVAVSSLRRALGDDARRPSYIETLPKFGYRLIAPVVFDGQAASGPRPKARPWLRWAALAAAFSAVILGSWFWGTAPRPSRLSPGAHRAYLEGRYLLAKDALSAYEEALERFARVLAAHPEFTPAREARAEALVALALRHGREPLHAFAMASRELERVSPDELSARGRALRGVILYSYEWDFGAAEADLVAALELQPFAPDLHLWYARLLTLRGRFDEAIHQLNRQRELEPDTYARPDMAKVLNMAERHSDASEELHRQLALEPRDVGLRFELARTYIALGEPARAASELTRLPLACATPEQVRAELDGDEPTVGICGLELAWLRGREENGELVPAVAFARAYAGTGATEMAIDWLERAFASREPGLLEIGFDPAFRELRGEPRFERLLQRIGLI